MSQPSPARARLSRKKLFVFATITALVPVVLMTAGLLAADLYLHKRAERSAGLNRWGYRGPVVGAKQSGETRLVVLGGSTAFGYGVSWFEAPPAVLQEQLNAARPGLPPVSVVNLGFNNEGAFAYRFTLDDFRFLDYDVVVLFDGYNDMMGDDGRNMSLIRHESPVFRLTGYYPILPLVLAEKSMLLRSGGNLTEGYKALRGQTKTVFTPSLADRASASTLETASAITDSLGRQLGRLSESPADAERRSKTLSSSTAGCGFPWTFYCQSMRSAVQHALDMNKRVVVVLQPRLLDLVRMTHLEQQGALSAMLTRTFGGDARFRLADLSESVDLADRNLAFDGMHLSVDGIKREITALVAAIGPEFFTSASPR